jgi:hypothetical protein
MLGEKHSNPGINIDFKLRAPVLTSPLATVPITAHDLEDDAMEVDSDVNDDTIDKLKEFELLPTLYNLLHDVQSGAIKAKDFDNNAGSLRLKLVLVRKYLQQIEGINESVLSRQETINVIKEKNDHKYQLLCKFKDRVQTEMS